VSRDFTVFWVVQTLSELGNASSLVAVPLLVLRTTGSVAQMGLITAISAVASICTGVFAGAITDRFDRRLLLMACDGARLVLYGAIPVCWAISPQLWVLYAVAAMAAAFQMIFETTYVAAIPSLVGKSQIVAANGRLATTASIALLAGPPLAGVLSGLFGPTAAITVNAASFGVSVAGVAVIRFRSPERPAGPPPRWHDLREGFFAGVRFLWRVPVLRALTLLLSVITFLSLGMTDIFIFQVRHGLGAGDRTVGYVLGVAGAGTVVAAVLTAALRRRLGFGRCWLGSYVLCGCAVAAIGVASSVQLVAVMVFAYSFGMGLAGICSMSLRQIVTPDHMLGRVTSAFWTLHGALAPAGAALLTLVVQHVGIRGPLLGSGSAFLLVAVIGCFTPIRQREPEHTREALGHSVDPVDSVVDSVDQPGPGDEGPGMERSEGATRAGRG
jgi:MFS family permease